MRYEPEIRWCAPKSARCLIYLRFFSFYDLPSCNFFRDHITRSIKAFRELIRCIATAHLFHFLEDFIADPGSLLIQHYLIHALF